MSEEKKENEHINIKVLGLDNAIVKFMIKKHTVFRKLMIAYCDRCSLSKNSVRFCFDGLPINKNDTPNSLNMEDGDTIEVYQQQTGGAFPFYIIYQGTGQFLCTVYNSVPISNNNNKLI